MDDDILGELASLPTFHHPTVSPDGSEVAVYYDETGRNELHVIDVETGERTQWSDGEVPRNARWYLEWGPDSERVFFHPARDCVDVCIVLQCKLRIVEETTEFSRVVDLVLDSRVDVLPVGVVVVERDEKGHPERRDQCRHQERVDDHAGHGEQRCTEHARL